MIHRIFFLLLIIFLPTQLGFHFWPEWSYVLGRRIDFLSPTLFVSDILLVSTVLFWVIEQVSRCLYRDFRERGKLDSSLSSRLSLAARLSLLTRREFKDTSTRNWFILLFAFITANTFNAASRPVAFYSWIKFFEYILLFLYIVKTKPSMHLLTFGIIIGVIYSSGIAIGQFLLQHSLGGIFWFFGERTFTVDTPGIARFPLCLPSFLGCIEYLRSYATFPHPNVLAGYLAVGILLIQNYPIIQLNNIRKIVIVLGFAALFVTFSRSGILVGVIVFLVSLLFCHSRPASECGVNSSGNSVNFLGWIPGSSPRMTKRILKFFFFVLCIFSLILGSWLVVHSFNPFEESVTVRQELMISSWNLFQSAPLFGIGLGNFIVRLPDALTVHAVYFLQPVHNIYLLLLSEIGIGGIVGLALLFFVLFGKSIKGLVLSIKGRKKNFIQRNTLLLTPYPLLAILLLGLVDHYWLTLQQGQLLFTVILGYSLCLFDNNIFGRSKI